MQLTWSYLTGGSHMETECDMACVPSITIGLNVPLYKRSTDILKYFLQSVLFRSSSSPRCRCQSQDRPSFSLPSFVVPTSPEICSAGRFTQCSVCTLMKWKLSDIPGPPVRGGGRGDHCFNQLDGIHPTLSEVFVTKTLPVGWPWHDWLVPPSQSPALQRWCFHNPLSLNGSCRYVLTLAADYVDSGTMVNGLNTDDISPLFISETKCPSHYYISYTGWAVDNQDRQPSNNIRESTIDNILSHWQSQSPRYGLFFIRLSIH